MKLNSNFTLETIIFRLLNSSLFITFQHTIFIFAPITIALSYSLTFSFKGPFGLKVLEGRGEVQILLLCQNYPILI